MGIAIGGALSSSPASPSSLTTIPPELLLRIISFLPGPSSFVSLAQTSQGLRQFVRQHASSICNEHIRSHFFASASDIFRCHLQDGWLVPGDRDFWGEEEEFLGRKTKCHAHHRARLEAALHRRIDTWVIPDFDDVYYRSVESEQSLCDRDNTAYRKFLLATPGPLYLAYLEEYAWDVENFTWQTQTSDSDTGDDSDEEPPRVDLVQRLRRPDARWRVSTYTIRPFLRKLDAAILNDCGCCVNSNISNGRPSPPRTSSPARASSSGLAQRILETSGLRRIFPFAGKEKKQSARLLFGELSPDMDDEAPKRDNKWGLGKESRSSVLLWTIVSGREERLAPLPVAGTVESLAKERKEQKIVALVKSLQDRTKAMGRRARLSLVSSSSRALSFVRRACLRKHGGFALLK